MSMREMAIAALLLAVGCSSYEYRDEEMGMRWKPPVGVKLESTSKEGDVTVARFTGGVEVRRVNSPALSGADGLEALKAAILAASKATAAGKVKNAKDGTVPAGPVARWELTTHDEHTLLYYMAASDHYFVMTLTAPEDGFYKRSDKFELSMSSLKLK
jgi:hypothetical protein